MRRTSVALLLVLSACGRSPASEVDSQGFSWRGQSLGVAARIHVDDPMQDIPVTIALYEGGRHLRTERSTLPFCMPDVDCWWAESYTTAPSGVDRVEVTVREGRTSTEPHEVIAIEERGLAPAAGTLFVVDEGPPMWGTAMTVDRGDRVTPGFLYVGSAIDRGEPGAD